MSQTDFHPCCENSDKKYIGHFEKELIPVFCCEPCFADDVLNGAKKIYNLKTKQEISNE